MAHDPDNYNNAEWDKVFPTDNSDGSPCITKSRYYELDDLKTLMKTVDDETHLSVLNVNARSLVKHYLEFRAVLSELPYLFDVITVEETWLNAILEPLVNMKNYTFITKHKSKRKEGGGLGIYVKNDLDYFRRGDLECPVEYQDFFDYMFIEINQGKNKTNAVIGVFYRPPGQNSIDDLSDHINMLLPKLNKENKNVLITGDNNVNLLKCDSHKPSANYLDTFLSNGFMPKITVPTRVTHNSATLIDHMFLNDTQEYINLHAGTLTSSMTDHYMNFIFISNFKRVSNPKYITYRPFTESNIIKLRNKLNDADFSPIYATENPNTSYNLMIDIYKKNLDEIIPLKSARFNKYKHRINPWITKGILTSIKHRDKLHKKMKNAKSLTQKAKLEKDFTEYRSLLHKTIQKMKRKYELDIFEKSKNNCKLIWKSINRIIGKNHDKTNAPMKIDDDGVTITDLKQIADCFNNYYVNVGPNLAKTINSSDTDISTSIKPVDKSFFFFPTHEQEINNIIVSLKPKTSSGHDDITPKIFKSIFTALLSPCVHIINRSMETGIVPDELKRAKVIPIYKKSGSSLVMKNYRPVSLLPVFSKILERVVYNRLFNYLVKHSILHTSQYGFQINLSTEQAILELQDRVTNILENGKLCVGIFMDLSKAFDTLDHSILLSKLQAYGIRGMALDWFRNYLSNRKQYVSINGTSSNHLPISCGVPQGSILGPLLFLIYINDLPNASNATTILFADDTNAIYTADSYDELMEIINDDLLNMSNWFKINKLALNASKTNFIIFHKKNRIPPRTFSITLNQIALERVVTTKFLGVLIHEHLDWKPHVDFICNKISKSIAILAKLKHYVPKYVLLTIYNSLCMSHISYALPVWGGSAKSTLHRLIILQKKGIRHVCNARYNSHTEPLFKDCNTLKIEDLFKLNCTKLMYKSIKGVVHNYHASKLVSKSDNSNIVTRQAHNVVILRHRHSKQYKINSLNYKIGTAWNELPLNIKTKSVFTLNTFTRAVKMMLLDRYDTNSICKDKHCYSCNHVHE